jgi:hypothetical protein
MMTNLLLKSLDEKYHKSIRYFSHSLKGEKRREFIEDLGDYNIYLAAQCVMSSEKDVSLEESLKYKAEKFASEFQNTEKSAKGFLALAELNSYEKISNLFGNIVNPSSIHLQVFYKILEGNDPSVFCSFLPMLVNAGKTILIQFAINAYNGDILLNDTTKEQIKKTLAYLSFNKSYGLILMMIKKYNLISDFDYVLGINNITYINEILKQNIRGIKLAYELASENNLLSELNPVVFVQYAANKVGKKPLIFAVETANKHNLKNIKELDNSIRSALRKRNRSGIRSLKAVSEAALLKYASDDKGLAAEVSEFFKLESQARLELYPTKYDDYEVSEELSLALNHEFNNYLADNRGLSIQDFIGEVTTSYEASAKSILDCIRKYEFDGEVKKIYDYGILVFTSSFRSNSLPLIHKRKITKDMNTNLYSIFSVGDSIRFRILGFNILTQKIYIKYINQEILDFAEKPQ